MAEPDSTTDPAKSRRRATTAFGWVAGGSLGLLLNYGAFLLAGDGYPAGITTFATFVIGAFLGMGVADRLGTRGFRPLGIAAGVLFALTLSLALAMLMTNAQPG